MNKFLEIWKNGPSYISPSKGPEEKLMEYNFELKATLTVVGKEISITNPEFKITAPDFKTGEIQKTDDVKERYRNKVAAQQQQTQETILSIRKVLGITETLPLEQTDDMVVIEVMDHEHDNIGDFYKFVGATWLKPTPERWIGELKASHFYVCHADGKNHNDIHAVFEVTQDEAYRINKFYHIITKNYQQSHYIGLD